MLKLISKVTAALFLLAGLISNLKAQTKGESLQILNKFEQWKIAQFKKGTYASDKNCANIIALETTGYNGTTTGIPKDITILYADINGDNKIDALVTFNPFLCDGGNMYMNTQIKVLILSNGSTYTTDDTFIDKIQKRYKDAWFLIERVSSGTFYGTYYAYKDSDPRCCPSVKRPIEIDYKTGKLTFNDGK